MTIGHNVPIAGCAWALKTAFTDKVESSESSLDAISSYWSACEIGARCSTKLFSGEIGVGKRPTNMRTKILLRESS